MRRSSKIVLIIIAAALLPTIVKLQAVIDPQRAQFQPGRGVASVMTQVGANPVVLPSQFVAGTVIGFREVVAGLLWVRTNDFFHSGNYDAIVPLTRIITWLDPRQIDVYRVGAWHLAYNFVDSYQRADRRYLAPGMKFLEEGIANNPTLWDLYFELGYTMYYSRVLDFTESVSWIKEAETRDAPYYVQRALAHAYEKAGVIDKCIGQWRYCIAQADKALKRDPNDTYAAYHRDVSKRNLDSILIEQMGRRILASRPIDANFEASLQRLGPRQFRISGRVDLPDGARIDLVLTDEGYQEPKLETFTWEVDPDVTALYNIGIHGMLVTNGRFDRKYDLSKDPRQYPLAAERYVLTLAFNPRTAPGEVQDVVGWHGEGMTDKKYLDTSIKGLRRIRKVIFLKRVDIL